MARIPIKSCGCEDWPCCEHADDFALTGADAIEAIEEERLAGIDEDPGQWTCEQCGGVNSTFDGECQWCDKEETPRSDYENDTPMGQQYGDGFEPDC